ncbi:hypothetical protein [Pleomorphomonas sp. PLEO]
MNADYSHFARISESGLGTIGLEGDQGGRAHGDAVDEVVTIIHL